jgi:glycosyltransferase involved in cell wall biosynthesis
LNLSVIVSSTFRRAELERLLESLETQEFQSFETVIVVQHTHDDDWDHRDVQRLVTRFRAQLHLVVAIDKTAGLSRSRNHGIKLATGDFLLLADEDCVFPPNALSTVVDAFQAYDRADICTFEAAVIDTGFPFKRYEPYSHPHNLRSAMGVSSIEIAMRHSAVSHFQRPFDERFGLGTKWPTAAENIFLADCLRRGLSMQFVPETIVLHAAESSGKRFNIRILEAKGAAIGRIFGLSGFIVCAAFVVKRRWKGELSVSFLSSVLHIFRGFFSFYYRTLMFASASCRKNHSEQESVAQQARNRSNPATIRNSAGDITTIGN